MRPLEWMLELRNDRQLSKRAKGVGPYLALHADRDTCLTHPSLELLAEECGWGETATREGVRELEAQGWLAVVKQGGRGRGDFSVYCLEVPERVRVANPSSPIRVRGASEKGARGEPFARLKGFAGRGGSESSDQMRAPARARGTPEPHPSGSVVPQEPVLAGVALSEMLDGLLGPNRAYRRRANGQSGVELPPENDRQSTVAKRKQ